MHSRRKTSPLHRQDSQMKRGSGSPRLGREYRPGTLDMREFVIKSVIISVCTVFALSVVAAVTDLQEDVPWLSEHMLAQLDQRAPENRRLLFFNRPPNTGSDSAHKAIEEAVKGAGLLSASCFERMHWNEMVMRTSLNRDGIDFYGCRARLPSDRSREVAQMRDGNVTFVTSTRDSTEVILSSYLEVNRARNLLDVTDPESIGKEVDSFRSYVAKYPVDALYNFHGAHIPMQSCPTKWQHVMALRLVVSRYEVVVDLRKPEESAEMIEIVTGLRPDFRAPQDEDREMDLSNPMLAALSRVDVSKASCGNELVHKVLRQQFNVIKDRLMQNRCFDEPTGTFELCERAVLKKSEVVERTRSESFRVRNELTKLVG